MIDLHTHTDRSDGTLTPAALVDRAVEVGLSAMAITDHDTFAGYELASDPARERGLDLVCGIELSTRPEAPSEGKRPPSIHLDVTSCPARIRSDATLSISNRRS